MSSILMGPRARKVEIDAILGYKGRCYGKVSLRVRRALIDSIPRIEIYPSVAPKAARDWRAEALAAAE